MAGFVCDRCGKCCVSLGRHIIIERQLSGRDYYCRSLLDNAIVPVSVDPAFREEIAGEFEEGYDSGSRNRNPCIFLWKDCSGTGTSCAVYASRPKVCREFRCYRMLIRNRSGTVCGRVVGTSSLRTDDTVLETLWKEYQKTSPYENTEKWLRGLTRVLADHGFGVESD